MLCTLVVLLLFAFFFFLPTMNWSPLHSAGLSDLIGIHHPHLVSFKLWKLPRTCLLYPPVQTTSFSISSKLLQYQHSCCSNQCWHWLRYSGSFQTATCVTFCFCFLTTIFYHSQVASLKNTSLIFIYIKYLSPSFLLHLLFYYFVCCGCMQ